MTVPSPIPYRTISAAAAAFSVPAAAITSDERSRSVSRARFAVYAALRVAGLSLDQAADACGRTDHTTVLSGIARCTELRADPDYNACYQLVEAAALGTRKSLAECVVYLDSWPRERAHLRWHIAEADAESDELDEAIAAVTRATKRLALLLKKGAQL